uniref:Keratin 99 n=1 Tax=Seriola lalandi dorsalis TaxID=1841481 RepID=A0A3B4XDS5_SERLL
MYSMKSSLSTHKFSSTSHFISGAFSLSGGRQLVGGGMTRISTAGTFKNRTPSVYGGAGGFGTRISQSTMLSGLGSYDDTSVITNEKVTMQNLNDRLASYLEKVRSLESANRKLELQIREFYERRAPTASRDYSAYFATISDLQAKISRRCLENQGVLLQMDNAQLAADDFKMKYQMEMTMRTTVEADVLRLRGVRDSLTLNISDLELQIESLKEELVYMKSTHKEEMSQVRVQQSGAVNVDVDSAESVDLTKVLQEVREQYEAVVVKNKLELDKWFQSKVRWESLNIYKSDITSWTVEVKTSHSELSELKRTYQSLEINRQSVRTEQNLEEVKSRYGSQLSQLQITINMLEVELQQLIASIEQQQADYKLLLDIKMRLELEIAEYRRLLEGEHVEKKAIVISKVVEKVEEHKPHIERRVKTIVEEIVDGKVVSSVVDTQVEDLQ